MELTLTDGRVITVTPSVLYADDQTELDAILGIERPTQQKRSKAKRKAVRKKRKKIVEQTKKQPLGMNAFARIMRALED
jgi:hypothetical protein